MSEERNETLSAHQVAAFLRRHPKFLEQYPDLAVSLLRIYIGEMRTRRTLHLAREPVR